MPPQFRRSAQSVQPFGVAPKRPSPTIHQLRVAEVRPLTASAVCITFAVGEDLRSDYQFRPGQHVVLVRSAGGEDIRRTYSICAPAGGPLRVAVKRLPGGTFSTWATTRLRANDWLGVMTPAGRFSLELVPSQAKHYVAIAAGSGITPILSNIATALEVERRSRVTLVYANRTGSSTMFRDELGQLGQRYPNRFTLHHVFSREPSPDGRLPGRLTRDRLRELLGGTALATGADAWLLCGPSALVRDTTCLLAELGVPAHAIHRELFSADDAGEFERPGGGAVLESDVTVVLHGERTSFHVEPSDGPILNALLPLRPDAPYACRDGVCATCRARVLEGDVTMRRSAGLDPEELRAGYVLACQAQPASERVVLDFDT